MDAWVWGVLIVGALGVAIVIWLLVRQARSRQLQRDFGSEYDRTMARSDDRSLAESDLRERRDRVEALHLRPLSRSDHDRFSSNGRRCRPSSWTHRRRPSPTPTD